MGNFLFSDASTHTLFNYYIILNKGSPYLVWEFTRMVQNELMRLRRWRAENRQHYLNQQNRYEINYLAELLALYTVEGFFSDNVKELSKKICEVKVKCAKCCRIV